MKSFIFAALAALASAAELGIDVTQEYICERPTKKGDTIDVHYTGTLTNGKKFDSSVDRGIPFSFTLGAGQVIKGWDQGLLNMCVGDKRTLTVPPEFGYGNRNMGPIPGGSTLIFTTELMGIRGVPKEELVPKPSASESSVTKEAASSETSSSSSLSTSESVESKQTTTIPAESATPETSATTEPKQTTTIPGDAAKATETENKDEL